MADKKEKFEESVPENIEQSEVPKAEDKPSVWQKIKTFFANVWSKGKGGCVTAWNKVKDGCVHAAQTVKG